MPTPIVVLSQSPSAARQALAYATRLAHALAVPVRWLRTAPAPAMAPATAVAPAAGPATRRREPPVAAGAAGAAAAGDVPAIAAALARQDALLVVMLRPANAPAGGWLPLAVWALLQSVRPPLLLVPGGVAAQGLPLRIALVADGDPFTLAHGQRAMHALLLTLPVHVTVLHAPGPRSTSSLADALPTLLACGLAARYLTTATTFGVRAHSGEADILAGARHLRANLLVLIVRPSSLADAGFGTSPTAALLAQSPVPVLLLLAADPAA